MKIVGPNTLPCGSVLGLKLKAEGKVVELRDGGKGVKLRAEERRVQLLNTKEKSIIREQKKRAIGGSPIDVY